MSRPRRIVIVGGGAAGTLVAIHLAARGAGGDGGGVGEVLVLEPAERLGEGIAYSTRSPSHLLNVRADVMSAFPERPGHFATWARGTGLDLEGSEFLPRMLYARYLRDCLAAAAGDGRGTEIRHLQTRAVGLHVVEGGVRVALADGPPSLADDVVLATGNGQAPLAWLPELPSVIRDPWGPGALDGLDPGARVAIVGSGLTAVDTVLTLRDRGHRGPLTMISSHGLLPETHAQVVLPTRAAAVDPGAVIGARALVRALRQDAATAGDWRQTIDAVRPVTVAVWRALPVVEQRRALRHAFRQWEVRRSRMAPQVARAFAALRAAGQLSVLRGRVRGVAWEGGALAIHVRSGGAETLVAADAVIACVGPSADPLHDPFLAAAIDDGVLVRHPLGLGVVVDDAGRALAPAGHAHPHVWTVGSLRRGADWETIAVPELRHHAADIATALTTEE